MGLFEKIGKALIEEVPTEMDDVMETYETPAENVNLEANLDDVNTDTLIEDIYIQNDLHDKSKSIFKVEELINSFPKEMATDSKRTSVISALAIFGLTTELITEDGENRVSILNSIRNKINEETNSSVSQKEMQMEEYKKAIAELEKQIIAEKNEMKFANEAINNEVNRIGELIKFLGGTNL